MNREARANLIFIGLFLALALPGIFMMTKKAYAPGGRDPAMRASVHTQFAYMDPTPPMGLTRVVPAGVLEHVQRIAQRLEAMQPGLKSVIAEKEPPIMSDRLNLQLLALGPGGGNYRVALFGWNSKYAPLPELYDITGLRGEQTVKGEMKEYEPANLPLEVRSELQDFGYVVPPDSVLWFVVTFSGEAPVESIRVKYHLDKVELLDTLQLPATSSQRDETR